MLARMLELRHSTRRTGPDAWDQDGNEYELKTTTQKSVGTGRDIGRDFLDRLRARYMVAAKGQQTDYGFSFEDVYVLHPDDLEGWIGEIESRIVEDEVHVNRALQAYRATGASDAEVERVEYLCQRGMTYNNPKISWAYIEEHGTRLGQNPALDLRELVQERPISPTSAAFSSDVAADDPPTPYTHPPSAEQ